MHMEAIGSEWVERLIDGKYPLLRWLGNSESGSVFLTENKNTSPERLAIKLRPAGAPNAEALIAAWTTATTLSHPHLMPVFDCGRCHAGDTSLIYSVTLYSEELLSQILAARPLSQTEAEELLRPVIDALSYLHGNGFVHGHLKPSNLMVLGDRVKLSPDRLEAVGDSGAHHKPADVYDAPERDRKTISPAADVWSLGVTLIEALIQRTPGWKPSMTRAPIVPKAVPKPFAEIAKECLRRNPSNRCTLSDIQARLTPEVPLQIEPAAAAAPEFAAEAEPEAVAEVAAQSVTEAPTEPAAEPQTASAAETEPEPASEAITESTAEAAAETVAETTTESVIEGTPAAEEVTGSVAEPAAKSLEEAATEPETEPQTESAAETAPEPASEAVTESAAQAMTETVAEAATESVTAAEPEPVAAPAAGSDEEATPESLPDFVPQPVTIPEPPPPRFRISSQNAILLGMLGLFVLVALLFHSHSPTAPAGKTPPSSAPSAQTSSPAAGPATTPGTASGTTPGQVVHKVLPDVPPSDSAKISSTIEVKVLVTVDAKGNIVDTILNVPGPDPSLASLALEAAQKWSFKPARVHNRPAQSIWVLEFQFGHNSTKVIPFEVSP